MTDPRNVERIAELLTEKLDRPLSADEERELTRRLAAEPGWTADDLEVAAAAAFVAYSGGEVEPLPPDLADRIASGAAAHLPSVGSGAEAGAIPLRPRESSKAGGWMTYAGWLAAAACLVWALFLWRRPAPGPTPKVARIELEPRVKGPAELRAEMLDRSDTIRSAWSATEDPLAVGVTGDVVWSGTDQKGYMRFRGLAKNDPGENQYQLWIFDADRDARHPVDGGVFDIDAESGDAVVPIVAKLKVHRATLFAITLERPGGVVVSSRERLVVLAKVEG